MAFQITDVQKSLGGMDYPASPDELARHAEGNGAEPDLVEALRSISGDRVDGPDDVMRNLRGQLTGSSGDGS